MAIDGIDLTDGVKVRMDRVVQVLAKQEAGEKVRDTKSLKDELQRLSGKAVEGTLEVHYTPSGVLYLTTEPDKNWVNEDAIGATK